MIALSLIAVVRAAALRLSIHDNGSPMHAALRLMLWGLVMDGGLRVELLRLAWPGKLDTEYWAMLITRLGVHECGKLELTMCGPY